jgi:hypothetical protein
LLLKSGYMKIGYYSAVLQLFHLTAIAQGPFGFEDAGLNGWIQSPPDRWEIAAEADLEGNFSLHHAYDNPAAGIDYVGRDIAYADLTDTVAVSFRVRHGYNPSSSNNWQMFFLANKLADLESGQRGSSAIIIGVNYTGSDDLVKIWQLYRGNVIEICSSGLDYQEAIGTSGEPLFRIVRLPHGEWSLACSLSGSADSLMLIGGGYETGIPLGKYMGFRYSYSPAQDRKLWLGEIRIGGRFFRDTVPPQVTRHDVTGLRTMEIVFGEEVIVGDSSFIWQPSPGAGGCDSGGVQTDSVQVKGGTCHLFFSKDFPNRNDQWLRVKHIMDLEGNVLVDTVLCFRQEMAVFGDLVITEIMTDPEPRVYLPSCEYVEIFNRYHEAIDVTGWTIAINSSVYELEPLVIMPGEYLLLTHLNCEGHYGEAIVQPVLGSATALTNAGGKIALYDQYGRMIHLVGYESMDRYDSDRSEGGWSLERVDPDNLCGGFENWAVSNGWRGGTPGGENSLRFQISDNIAPSLQYTGVPDSLTVLLTFDEHLLLHEKGDHWFTVDGTMVGFGPGSVALPSALRTIELAMNEPLERDMVYDLEVSGVWDCAGNRAGVLQEQFRVPVLPRSGVPLINEVMYDPVDGGNEYFELYNPQDAYLDLSDLRYRVSACGSMEGKLVELSGDSHLLPPGGFAVFTKSSRVLCEEWELGRRVDVVEVPQWRTLPNGGAELQLTGRAGEVLDKFCYHDSLHHDMVGVTTGVALERIHSGTCMALSQCWTSAAASVNYGTPGSRNSQDRLLEHDRTAVLGLYPEVFSPDNDGFEDMMEISLPEGDQQMLIDICITDTDGVRVRDIIFRGIRGTSDTFYWDGQDNSGRIVLPGIYVVHVVTSGERGRKVVQKACAVRYR